MAQLVEQLIRNQQVVSSSLISSLTEGRTQKSTAFLYEKNRQEGAG